MDTPKRSAFKDQYVLDDLPELASLSDMAQSWGVPRYSIAYVVDNVPIKETERQGNRRVFDRTAQGNIARRVALSQQQAQMRASQERAENSQLENDLIQATSARLRQHSEEIALLKSQNALLTHQVVELLARIQELTTSVDARLRDWEGKAGGLAVLTEVRLQAVEAEMPTDDPRVTEARHRGAAFLDATDAAITLAQAQHTATERQ